MVNTYIPIEVQKCLNTNPIERVRNGLGGSHTVVTYPPIDALQDVVDGKVIEKSLKPTNQLNLYFHIAFCEHICPFCHYAKTYTSIGDDSPAIVKYMSALSHEMEMRGHILEQSNVSSIYIGGGTPTSISLKLLNELFENFERLIPNMPKAICAETSPQTVDDKVGEQKLQHLIDKGVNRLSMGVQSFDDRLLRRTRGHGRGTLLRAMDRVSNLGISLNIDMIQDLPDQSLRSIEDDLSYIEKYKPQQVTWYMLRPESEASWYKLIKRGDLKSIVDTDLSAKRRFIIRRHMRDLGYTAQIGGRFVRRSAEHDIYKSSRNDARQHLLGFGVSAYSHGWGGFFKNVSSHKIKSGINDYIDRLDRNKSPIDSYFELTETEHLCGARIMGIRDILSKELFEFDDLDSRMAQNTIDALIELGLVEQTADNNYRLSVTGELFEEEIASLFYSQKAKDTLRAKSSFWLDTATENSLFGMRLKLAV